jgi:hypothetical protein
LFEEPGTAPPVQIEASSQFPLPCAPVSCAKAGTARLATDADKTKIKVFTSFLTIHSLMVASFVRCDERHSRSGTHQITRALCVVERSLSNFETERRVQWTGRLAPLLLAGTTTTDNRSLMWTTFGAMKYSSVGGKRQAKNALMAVGLIFYVKFL